MPAVNIREDDKNYFLDLAVPGIDRKELKIDMNVEKNKIARKIEIS